MNKHRKIILVSVISIVLIIACVVCLVLLDSWFAGNDIFSGKTSEEIQDDLKAITVNGVQYVPKNVKTLLIVGLDSEEEIIANDDAYRNNNQADFLMLIVFDKDLNKATPVLINRDTIAPVTRISVSGQLYGTEDMQIALAHTYGGLPKTSLENTKKAVSDLFGGLQIDYSISMNLSAVETINDYVAPDGVTIDLDEDEDLSALDPDWTAGSRIILNGVQAQKFVRARSETQDGTNISRMERQKQYLKALFQAAPDRSVTTEKWIEDGFDRVKSDVYFNWSSTEFKEVVNLMANYNLEETFISPEGEADYSGTYVSFYADKNSLNQILTTYFYKKRYES